jgi:hypothetical protein
MGDGAHCLCAAWINRPAQDTTQETDTTAA